MFSNVSLNYLKWLFYGDWNKLRNLKESRKGRQNRRLHINRGYQVFYCSLFGTCLHLAVFFNCCNARTRRFQRNTVDSSTAIQGDQIQDGAQSTIKVKISRGSTFSQPRFSKSRKNSANKG